MSNQIVTQIIEQVNDLPDNLQQEVLSFVITLRQEHYSIALCLFAGPLGLLSHILTAWVSQKFFPQPQTEPTPTTP